jgi:hypothetical protein
MADKTCGNCAYYHPADKDRLRGQCRIQPPHTLMSDNGQLSGYWPSVDALDWCGQFMSRENLYEKKKKK